MRVLPPQTPIFRQINPIECGAVCLRIIWQFHGIKKSQRELNELVGITENGSDAQSLIKAAHHLGINATAHRRAAFELKKNKTPSIVFFNNCHFVVFEGFYWGKFYINDPARGRYQLSQREFHHRFSGVEITFAGFKKIFTKPSLRSFDYSLLGIAVGLLLGSSIALLSHALVSTHKTANGWSLGAGIITIVLFFISNFIAIYWQGQKKFTEERIWYKDFLDKVRHVSSSFFETRPFDRVNTLFFKSPVIQKYREYAFGIAIGICLIQYSIWPGYAVIMTLAVLFWQFLKVPHGELAFPEIQRFKLHASILKDMGQNYGALRRALFECYDFGADFYARAKQKQGRFFLELLVLALLLLYAVLIGPYLLESKNALLSSIALALVAFYFGTQRNCIDKKNHDHEHFIDELDSFRKQPTQPLIYREHIITLSFARYILPKEHEPLFKDVAIKLSPNHFYGVVGNSREVLRIIGQKIAVKDMDYRHYYDGDNPCKFAMIDDDADIFSGTLLENVRVFDQKISEHKVVQALIDACCEELLYHRPMGLLSFMEVHGANISGGQKKRLLLARALVQNPSVLILDNFFDSLDQQKKITIFSTLRKRGITVIFSSLHHADLSLSDAVIFVDDKKWIMAPHGTHLKKEHYEKLIVGLKDSL